MTNTYTIRVNVDQLGLLRLALAGLGQEAFDPSLDYGAILPLAEALAAGDLPTSGVADFSALPRYE